MQNKSRAFTLIELLVVVLIIGILAAVAVPQYQVAVEKSRATEALVALRSLRNAMEICKMETGTACPDLSSLPINLPGTPVNDGTIQTKYFTISIGLNNTEGGAGYELVAQRRYSTDTEVDYTLYHSWNKFLLCRPSSDNAIGVCRSLCGGNVQKGFTCVITSVS